MKQQASPKFAPAQAQALFERAHAAGMAAGEKARPRPMHVVQRENPFDENSPIVKRYAPVMDGVCGFAWINIRPGNGSFASWMRRRGMGHKSYHGGWDYWVSEFNQSLERKSAYAQAFAEILREAGIKAHAMSRID